MKKMFPWFLWLAVSIGIGGYLLIQLQGKDKSVFLIGNVTHGHHQIEMVCDACHTSPFGGGEVLQDACVKCHGKELKLANDSHPRTKFTDPRNADRVEILDARKCITCHTEHQPELNHKMGLTLPGNYCAYCHQDIGEDRPSHKDLAFDTCASSGCHNYHDNRALYEDFLLKHTGEPHILPSPVLPSRNLHEFFEQRNFTKPALALEDLDAPNPTRVEQLIKEEWGTTVHARSGVNCSDCHVQKDIAPLWTDKPGHQACATCHDTEVAGFLDGKHGMRLKQDLSPMKPDIARQPMHDNAGHKELNCQSCHSSHRFDTESASVDACQSCHSDSHTTAYKQSPHYQLLLKERGGVLPGGSGVSCASCHMPRLVENLDGRTRVKVQHNQNDNLRPNEKMIRDVCMNCHGLGFSIDALADEKLVKNNFNGKPARHVPGIDWARKRVEEKQETVR